MIDRVVREQIRLMLENWYICDGRYVSTPVLSNAAGWGKERLGNDSHPEHAVTPFITADAQRVDRALNQMTQHEREILVESYCVPGTQESSAKVRKMALRTYQRWLGKAEESFWDAYRFRSSLASVAPRLNAPVSDAVETKPVKKKRRRKRGSILPAAQALARPLG
jgi:hypothetical protein